MQIQLLADSMIKIVIFLIKNDDSIVKMNGLCKKLSKTICFYRLLESKPQFVLYCRNEAYVFCTQYSKNECLEFRS